MMLKYISVFLLLSCALAPAKTHRELFDDFHNFFAARDFNKMDQLLSEDFTCAEKGKNGDSKPGYMKYMMEWNTTFNTKWIVDTVYISGDQVISIEHDSDAFINYFHGGEMKDKFVYSFGHDQITNLTYEHLPGFEKNSAYFENRFSAFMKWVSDIHPSKLKYCTKHDLYAAQQVKALLEEYLKIERN